MTCQAVALSAALWAAAGNSMEGPACQAQIHRLGFTSQHMDLVRSLPVGIAVIGEIRGDNYALAVAYRDAIHQTPPPRATGKRSIVAAGPQLDSPDRVEVRDCRVEAGRITIRVVHTHVVANGGRLYRNNPFRPLIEVPVNFDAGRYTVEVEWQAVDALPDGKAIAPPVMAGPVVFNL